MSFSRWDVVTVPFPYVEKEAAKKRPALVVSNPEMQASGLCWLMMITSQQQKPWPGDVPIRDLKKAGLPKSSVIRTMKLTCVPSAILLEQRGSLGGAERKEVEKWLKHWCL